VRYIIATKKKTGRWPTVHTREVWDMDAYGRFTHLNDETWPALQQACAQNLRGLKGLRSLAALRKKHGLHDAPRMTFYHFLEQGPASIY
jgi:hypothetical protein